MSKKVLNEGVITIGSQSYGMIDAAFSEDSTRINTADTSGASRLKVGRVAAKFRAKIISDHYYPIAQGGYQSLSLEFAQRLYSGNGFITHIREEAKLDDKIILEVMGEFKGASTATGVDLLLLPLPNRAGAMSYLPEDSVQLPPIEIPMGARSAVARNFGPTVSISSSNILPGNVYAIAVAVPPTVLMDLSVIMSQVSTIVSSMIGDVIDTAHVYSTIGTGGDYPSVQAWIADKAGDFVTSKVVQHGILISDVSVTSAINFNTGSATTNMNYYWHLTSNKPTNGVDGFGYRLINNLSTAGYFIQSSNQSVRIDGIEFDMNSNDSYSMVDISGADLVAIQNCLFHDWYCSAGTGFGVALRNGSTVIFSGNVIRDCEFAGTISYGFFTWNYDFLHCYNNLIYNCYNIISGTYVYNFYIYVQAGANAYIKNNSSLLSQAVSGNADYVIQLVGGSYEMSNNISGDTTAPGSNSFINQVATDLYINPSFGDFRLKGGSNALDNGVFSGYGSPDIAGIIRPVGSTWDIGPYETNYVQPTPINSIGAKIDPTVITIPNYVTSNLIFDGGDFMDIPVIASPNFDWQVEFYFSPANVTDSYKALFNLGMTYIYNSSSVVIFQVGDDLRAEVYIYNTATAMESYPTAVLEVGKWTRVYIAFDSIYGTHGRMIFTMQKEGDSAITKYWTLPVASTFNFDIGTIGALRDRKHNANTNPTNFLTNGCMLKFNSTVGAYRFGNHYETYPTVYAQDDDLVEHIINESNNNVASGDITQATDSYKPKLDWAGF